MRRRILAAVVMLVLVGAGIRLWRWSEGGERGPDFLGGPLFHFTVDEIDALEMRRVQGTTWLKKDENGSWILTGEVTDIVDPVRVRAELSMLTQGFGLPVLAGTQPDERRFGFGGAQSLELVFHLRGEARQRLALGDHNPVTDVFYASGAGRSGVFGVSGALHAAALRLPDSVRMARLLPQLRSADLDSLHLGRRGDVTLFLARIFDDRWWMRRPARSPALAGKAARYHERYADRRIEHGGSIWFLADDRNVRDLVYDVTGATITIPGPDQHMADILLDEDLVAPYRTLDLWVRGGPSYHVEFGREMALTAEFNVVPAIRQGSALVLLRPELVWSLLLPVSAFLDLGALSFRTAIADSFRVDEPDRPLLWAVRAADPQARREAFRSIWDPVVPPGWSLNLDRETAANHLTDLQGDFDALECLAVLDPEPADPLQTADRWRLRAWVPGQGMHEVWLGRLRRDGRPVVWSPADGKCLEVPQQILVTLRNLRHHIFQE